MAIDLAIAALFFGLVGLALGAVALFKVNQFVKQGSMLKDTELTNVTCGKGSRGPNRGLWHALRLYLILAFSHRMCTTYNHPLLPRTPLQNPANSVELERPTTD